MKKSYYLFNPGRLSRKDNTLKFVPVNEEGVVGKAKYLPVEGVQNLFCFGSLDANSALYNFLGRNQIGVHFFDFYEHYTGSFMPKEYLLSGKVLVNQVTYHNSTKKRIVLAQSFIEGAAFNMLKNLKYYNKRGRDLSEQINKINKLVLQIPTTTAIDELMGVEGNIRIAYYTAFSSIITDYEMNNRTKQPPNNEVNAMISFVNMLCYTQCLDQIYHTQLNPTISFLHEPGFRRFSLALDIAEVFKPLLADRLIFSMFNKKIIKKSDFDSKLNSCLLKDSGRKKILRAWDEKLNETFKHRSLDRSISYKRLVRLECYKLVKHIMVMQEYKPFKTWW